MRKCEVAKTNTTKNKQKNKPKKKPIANISQMPSFHTQLQK
jgi:hypothetical protein